MTKPTIETNKPPANWKNKPITDQGRAFVVVTHHFCAKRQMRHEEEGQEDPHGDREAEHPGKQPGIGKAGGRRKQQIKCNAKGQGADQHEWMAAAPARFVSVGQLPNHGVSNCINNEGEQRRHSGQTSRQSQNLVEIEEKKDGESGVLYT